MSVPSSMTPRRWRADAQVLRQLAQEIEHTPNEARLPCGVECNTAFDIRVAPDYHPGATRCG